MPQPDLSLVAPSGFTSTLPAGALIGCAGWTVPKRSAAHFPVEGSHLERFAAAFGAVEINKFLLPPAPARRPMPAWAASTPTAFRFSVKVPRTVTHEAPLADPAELLDRFAAEAGALGDKLGCALTQLPPKLAFDAPVVDAYFTELRRRFACMLACEARHPSWFAADATALLTSHDITRVIADPAAGQPGPHVPTSAAI